MTSQSLVKEVLHTRFSSRGGGGIQSLPSPTPPPPFAARCLNDLPTESGGLTVRYFLIDNAALAKRSHLNSWVVHSSHLMPAPTSSCKLDTNLQYSI